MKIIVKWGKNTYSDVEVDPSGGIETLQLQLFSLTQVPVERQKMLLKGKMLKSSDDLKVLSDGATLMLMGTAEAVADAPKTKVVFEEDLTDKQKIQMAPSAVASAGLQNLGNTCYMNSTLQCLRAVPELKEGLKQFQVSNRNNPGNDLHHALAFNLGALFSSMDSTTKTVTPMAFTSTLRSLYPQFDEVNPETGRHSQQDADECMTQILTTLSQKLSGVPKTGPGDPSATNLIDYLFGGEVLETLTLDEKDVPATSEPAIVTKDKFRKLRCHIDIKTNYLTEGIERGLEEPIEKKSPSLGRMAMYKKKSVITKLPAVLLVQFVRFFWRNDTKKKAKSLRKVSFPDKLDMLNFCDDKLKASLNLARKKLAEEKEKQLGLLSVIKSTPAPGGKPGETKKENKDDKPADKSGKGEKKEEAAPMEIDASTPLPKDSSGQYEMFGVVTHQGRFAESGHYIGWARVKDDVWLKYDDDVVTQVSTDDIKQLSGGGDWHMSYLLLYRRIDDMKDKKFDTSSTPASTTTGSTGNTTGSSSAPGSGSAPMNTGK